MNAKQGGVSRRRLGLWWLASSGLLFAGCGGGGLDPLDVVNEIDNGSSDADPLKDCNSDQVIDVKDDCNGDGKLDDSDKQCCRGSTSSGSGQDGTLYQAYLALRSGMTRAQVIAAVPVSPSQGASTDQVLWVKGDEALGVKFNGSADASVITFAQWGLSIAAGGRNESRNF
jgi:hypothetical protein